MGRELSRPPTVDPATRRSLPAEAQLEKIRSAVAGIHFGEVRLIIQDGYIVQIERVEKERFR